MHSYWAATLAQDHRDRLLADAQRAQMVRRARQNRPDRDDDVRTVRVPRPWRWLRRRRTVIATT